MAWLILLIAGILEIVWAVGLKYTAGFTKLMPSIGTVCAMIASVVLLGFAMRDLPVGTAYAVWTGIGAVGAVIMGIILFDESVAPMRLVSAGMIVCGLIGLKLSS